MRMKIMARHVDVSAKGKQYRIIVQEPGAASPEGTTVVLFDGSREVWRHLLAPGESESEIVGQAEEIAKGI